MAARGKVKGKRGAGDPLADVKFVELKAALSPRQIERTLEKFGVGLKGGEKRAITFYDTPALDHSKSGVLFRSRRIHNRGDDSTVKFRPKAADGIPKTLADAFHDASGFKIEADSTGPDVVCTASLTCDVAAGLITRVKAGKSAPAILFQEQQARFIAQVSSARVDWGTLAPLGPLDALVWKPRCAALPWELTVELWTRPDGAAFLEASVRVPIAQMTAANAGFLAFLAESKVALLSGQVSKTRWALEYFSALIKKPAKATRRPAQKAAPTKKAS